MCLFILQYVDCQQVVSLNAKIDIKSKKKRGYPPIIHTLIMSQNPGNIKSL